MRFVKLNFSCFWEHFDQQPFCMNKFESICVPGGEGIRAAERPYVMKGSLYVKTINQISCELTRKCTNWLDK